MCFTPERPLRCIHSALLAWIFGTGNRVSVAGAPRNHSTHPGRLATFGTNASTIAANSGAAFAPSCPYADRGGFHRGVCARSALAISSTFLLQTAERVLYAYAP